MLDPFGIEVQTPDEFVLNQLMLEKLTARAALKRMRERWAGPQYAMPRDRVEVSGLDTWRQCSYNDAALLLFITTLGREIDGYMPPRNTPNPGNHHAGS